ncbi:MAG: Methyl-accepting chemotaxis protein II [Firmicutes bacterium ADurb.Bin419]|nr:MAG: Methyl-accepting chemotaxis protein II [Firmicutes bacterium ADurb.Bin419]
MMKWISDLSIRKKIYLILSSVVISVALFGLVAISSSGKIQESQIRLEETARSAMTVVLNADRDLYQAYTAIQVLVFAENSPEDILQQKSFFDENVKTAKERVAESKSILENSDEEWEEFKGEESKLTVFELIKKFETDVDKWILNSNKVIENKSMDEEWESSFETARGELDEIGIIVDNAAKEKKIEHDTERRNVRINIFIGLFVLLVLIFIFGYLVVKDISRPLASVVAMIKEIEKGHLKNRLNLNRKDEIGQLADSMDHYADDLQKYVVLPINKIAVGDFDFELNIKDSEDELSPSIMKTVEAIKGLVYEANTLTNAAIEGKLQTRGRADNFSGLYKEIIQGINKTLDAVIDPINEASSVLAELEKGNLTVRMNGNYKGEHAIIKEAMNKTVSNLKGYVGEITQVLHQMAEGNMDITTSNEFKGDFVEIKTSLDNILDSFNDVLIRMGDAAYQVSAGSKQIADSSQMLSQSTTEQASSVEELSSIMETISEKTKKNAQNSKEANELAMIVKEDAVNGNDHMKDMLKSMDEIASASSNISKIIKVIDDIAFQTNILALNAAVEAARAGQHGKGFAVVADEVRSLAGRSSQAAKETTSLIEGTVQKTEKGMTIAKETAEALNKIVDGVSKAAYLVAEISESSNEQATGIAQVNLGVMQISQVVQTNSATSQQSAASSEELSSQADTLNYMVSRFQVRKNNKAKSGYEMLDNEIIGYLEETDKKSKPSSKKKLVNNKKNISLDSMDYGKY